MRQTAENTPVYWGRASHHAFNATVHSRARRNSLSSRQASITLQ